MFTSLFEKYDRLVLFDTETTGLQYSRDEIIEFAAVVVEPENGQPKVTREYDELVALAPGTLLLAYNAHFDLSFLFYMLLRDGDPAILKGKDKLDLLTVYKDRHTYPHRLCNAIEVYGLTGKVVNSHRAVDDVLATVAVMEEMEKEKDDLVRYVNLFGYNPKYGVEGKPIGSVTYKAQPYDPAAPLYEN